MPEPIAAELWDVSGSPEPSLTISFIRKESFQPDLKGREGVCFLKPNFSYVFGFTVSVKPKKLLSISNKKLPTRMIYDVYLQLITQQTLYPLLLHLYKPTVFSRQLRKLSGLN